MKDLLLSSYDYTLPNELIATYPVHPKEDAKLLVFERKNNQIFILLLKIYKISYLIVLSFLMILR